MAGKNLTWYIHQRKFRFMLAKLRFPKWLGPNGEQITKIRTEISSRVIFRTAIIDKCEAHPTHTSPGFSFSGFILGSHDDVAIDAVSLPAVSVMKALLKRFTDFLKIIVLCVDEDYFRAELEKTLPARNVLKQ